MSMEVDEIKVETQKEVKRNTLKLPTLKIPSNKKSSSLVMHSPRSATRNTFLKNNKNNSSVHGLKRRVTLTKNEFGDNESQESAERKKEERR